MRAFFVSIKRNSTFFANIRLTPDYYSFYLRLKKIYAEVHTHRKTYCYRRRIKIL